jgi:hypothetical protein
MSYGEWAQAVFAGSRRDQAERNHRTQEMIEAYLRAGMYVVVYDHTDYCRETDAILDRPTICYEVATSRWEAERKLSALRAMEDDEMGNLHILPKRSVS